MTKLLSKGWAALARLCLVPLAAALLGSIATAQTFIVDDSGGPGVDFLTIQEAVNAAPAGAVLLVREGDYDSFVLEKALTIVGAGPGTRIDSFFPPVRIRNLTGTGTAAISRMGLRNIDLTQCQSTVVLDELSFFEYYGVLRAVGCEDLRCSGLQQEFFTANLLDSRVQLTRCYCSFIGALGSSVVHVSNSVVVGDDGGPCETTGCLFDGTLVPDGYDAIGVGPNAYLRLVDSIAVGGAPGYNSCGCSGFGSVGRSCVVRGVADVWNTRTSVNGPLITVDTAGGGAFSDQTPLPSLDISGTGALGTIVGFEVSSPPGTSARFILGRGPDRVLVPNSSIERLVQLGRVASLGQVPPSGTYSLGFQQPGLAPGTVIWAQTSATFATGQTEMSNAVAFIIPQ